MPLEKRLVPDFRLMRELVRESAHLRTEDTQMGRFRHQFTQKAEIRHQAFLEGHPKSGVAPLVLHLAEKVGGVDAIEAGDLDEVARAGLRGARFPF